MTDYNDINSGEVYLSSLGDLGRDSKTILINYILEASKKANHVSKVYRKVLEAMILRFQTLSYIDSENEEVSLQCFHANPERAIAKLNQENNIVLPALTLSQDYSEGDNNRVRTKNILVTKTIKNENLNKVERVVTLAPRPVNIIYSFNVWSKYMSDLDQITEQVRGEFNPHIDIHTDLGISKVFLVTENNNSEVVLGDGSDRVLRKSFRFEIEAYIPYPEFLLTSNGRITDFNIDTYQIIDPPINRPTDFTRPQDPVDPGTFPGSTGTSGITSDPEDLEVYYMIPEFGPWYLNRTFNIEGAGFQVDTLVIVGDVPASTTVLLDEYNYLVNVPPFDSSDAGTFKTLTVKDPDTEQTIRVTDLFEISPVPQVSTLTSSIVVGDVFTSSSLEIMLSGTAFDSYLDPYYVGDSLKTKIYIDDYELDTTIISDLVVSGTILITEDIAGRTVDVTVSNYNGSSTGTDLIVVPELSVYDPGETLELCSVTPTFGPWASSIELQLSGGGFLEASKISVTMKGQNATVVDSPTLSGLTILTPEFAASDIGTTADITVTVSGSLVQTSSLAGGWEISPAPFINTNTSTVYGYNGLVPSSIDFTVEGTDLSGYIDPYYSSDDNRSKLSISSVDYGGSPVTFSTVIVSDTIVSANIPVNPSMYNLDFDVTVSNINGSSNREELLSVITGPVSSSPLLYLEPNTISNPLVQAVVPITPVTITNIPTLYIDGSACDTFPVSYTADDKVDVVQVVGPASGGGTSYLTNTGGTSLPGSDEFATLSLSGVEFSMDVVGVVDPMMAYPFLTEQETIRDGKRIDETRFHSLIYNDSLVSTNELYSCGNVQSFVTRRSDTSGIDIWLLIANDNYDLTNDPRVGGDTHPEISGEVWFKSIQLTNLPSGYRLYSEFDDPSMDTSAGYIIQPVDNGSGDYYEQLFPARQRIIRHYVIGPDTVGGAAEALELLEMKDYCEVRAGDYSYYNLSGFGAQRDYLPQITEDYQHLHGPFFDGSGWDVMDYRCSTTFDALKTAADTGDVDDKFFFTRNWGGYTENIGTTTSNMVSGYYHPYGHSWSRKAGGFLVHLRNGWQNNRWLWRASQVQLTYQIQRHDSSITDVTGDIVTASAMAASNPDSNGDSLYIPWSLGFGLDQPQYWWPWYSYDSTTTSQEDRALAPTRLWSTPSIWSNTLYYDVDADVSAASYNVVRNFKYPNPTSQFGPYEGDHSSRFNQTLQPLIWSCNLGIAKWVAKQEACHAVSILCPYEVRNSLYTGQANGPNDYQSNNFNLDKLLENINDNDIQWGRRIPNIYPNFQRGWGIYCNIIAEGMRIEHPSTNLRTEYRVWSNQYALLYHLYASNTGTVGGRDNPLTSDQSHIYGTYDGVNASGAPPVEFDGQQLYMVALFSNGLLSILQAFFGLDSVVADSFRRTLEVLPYYLWDYADQIGNEYSQNFVLHSNTLNSTDDPPPTEVVGWDFKSGYVGGGYTPVAEMRCGSMLYTGFLLTNNIKFAEWLYILMTQYFLEDGGQKQNSNVVGISIPMTDTWERPTDAESAIKLFNQTAGQEAAYFGSGGWETERVWSSFIAPFIGLLSHKTGEIMDAPNIPTSLYDSNT